MVKKILMMLSICCMISGCGEKETVTEQAELKVDETEIVVLEGEKSEEAELEEKDVEREDYAPRYKTEDYGEVFNSGNEFYDEEEVKGYYYNIEKFYFNSDFLHTMNDTLEAFYDQYLKKYQEMKNQYMEKGKPETKEENIPYSELLFDKVLYVDMDYVSLIFNDVTYMGGDHPYFRLDAITIDRHSGKEVMASEFLGRSDEKILKEVSYIMGLPETAGWDEIDFFLQEEEVIFFYRSPGLWSDVMMERKD